MNSNTLSNSRQAVRRRNQRKELRALKAKCEQGGSAKRKQKVRVARPNSFSTQSRLERGVDVLGVMTISKDEPVGSVLLRFVVNPRSMEGTRLAQMSRLWQRWTPKSLRLQITSAAGKMVPGGYVAAWFADPKETLSGKGELNVKKMVTSGCSVQQPVGNGAVLMVPMRVSRPFYSFTGDSFDDSHGVIYVVNVTSPGASAVSITASLHWTILLDGPDMPSPVEENYTQPEADYTPCFTDSVSDWAEGKRLTFKAHEGGSVVPWENLRDNYIYTPTNKVKIPYYKTDGTAAECKFFSKMRNEPAYDAALVCHASEQDAKDYQNTFDISKVLQYRSAGGWAEPASPVLSGVPVVNAKLDMAPPCLARPGPSLVGPVLTSSHVPEIDYDRLANLVVAKMRLGASTSSIEVVDYPSGND